MNHSLKIDSLLVENGDNTAGITPTSSDNDTKKDNTPNDIVIIADNNDTVSEVESKTILNKPKTVALPSRHVKEDSDTKKTVTLKSKNTGKRVAKPPDKNKNVKLAIKSNSITLPINSNTTTQSLNTDRLRTNSSDDLTTLSTASATNTNMIKKTTTTTTSTNTSATKTVKAKTSNSAATANNKTGSITKKKPQRRKPTAIKAKQDTILGNNSIPNTTGSISVTTDNNTIPNTNISTAKLINNKSTISNDSENSTDAKPIADKKKLLKPNDIKQPSIVDTTHRESDDHEADITLDNELDVKEKGKNDINNQTIILDIPLYSTLNNDYLDENGTVVFNVMELVNKSNEPTNEEKLNKRRNLVSTTTAIKHEDDTEQDNNTPKKKSHPMKGKSQIGKYDFEDPFIDDSELQWEEQRVSTNDGFFVFFGPLIEKGQQLRIEKLKKKR